MPSQIFSNRKRPFHLGPFPMERLKRIGSGVDFSGVPKMKAVCFDHRDTAESLVNSMNEYQAMLDAIRIGIVGPQKAQCPDDPDERARHIRSFGYFQDAPMVGIAELVPETVLSAPIRNPEVDRLAEELKTKQVKSLASGIDVIMADLKESLAAPASTVGDHTHAVVFMYHYNRDPDPGEPGFEWMGDAQEQRACLLGTETAAIIAGYFRTLG